MNKKGILNIPWIEVISGTVFVLFVIFLLSSFGKGCSLIKKTSVDDEQINRFAILTTQINNLNKDEVDIFPLSLEKEFVIDTYRKCKENEKPDTHQCSSRAKICLIDISDSNVPPRCTYVDAYIENTDSGSKQRISAANGLVMKKVEDKILVTEITAKT